MATTTVGALSVKITADAKNLNRELATVKKELKSARKSVNDNAAAFAKWSAAGVTAAAAIGTAIFKVTSDNIRELNNLAFAANTVTEEFQRGAFAAQQFGIEQEKYGDILKDVTDRVGDFVTTGGGPMASFFETVAPKIGITADAFRGLSGQDALGLFVKSLEEANLSQEEMTFHMEAMASDSTRLLPLFQNNAEALRAMTEEAKALGIGLSEIDSEQVEQAGKAINSAGAVMSDMIQEAVADLAPLMQVLAEGFTTSARGARGFGNELSAGADIVVNSLGFIMDAFAGVDRVVGTLGKTVALVVLQTMEDMLDFADSVINGPYRAIQRLIKAMNTLPWHDIEQLEFSDWGKSIEAELAVVRGAIDAGIEDISESLAAPLPSQVMKEGIENAKKEAQALRDQAAEAKRAAEEKKRLAAEKKRLAEEERQKRLDSGEETNDLSSDTKSLIDRFKTEEQLLREKLANEQAMLDASLANQELSKAKHAELGKELEAQNADEMRELKLEKVGQESAALLEAMQERYESEREQENEKFKLDNEALKAHKEEGLMTKDEFDELEAQRKQEHTDRLVAIERKEQSASLKNAADGFDRMAQLSAVGGKKTEKITRALSITSAVIKGYESAVSAYAHGNLIGGPILGAAYAAASVAQTGALIAKMKSGSKSSPTVGGAGVSGSAPAVVQSQETRAPEASKRFDISIGGDGFVSSSAVRQLIERINEETDSGVILNATISGA